MWPKRLAGRGWPERGAAWRREGWATAFPTQVEGINKKEVRKYRQYMNRRGGFNRPLEEGGGAGF